MNEQNKGAHRGRWWYLLLLVPFAALLWPPFYNKADPHLAGIPFFYWYQFLWVPLGAAVTAIVHFATARGSIRR